MLLQDKLSFPSLSDVIGDVPNPSDEGAHQLLHLHRDRPEEAGLERADKERIPDGRLLVLDRRHLRRHRRQAKDQEDERALRQRCDDPPRELRSVERLSVSSLWLFGTIELRYLNI